MVHNIDCRSEKIADYRQTAMQWHGGQWSELYMFGSSGVIHQAIALCQEIERCLKQARIQDDAYEVEALTKLFDYVNFKQSEDWEA